MAVVKPRLAFVEQPQPREAKTQRWAVFSAANHVLLGEVRWMPTWRRYCLFASDFTVWDASCLREVAAFLEARMAERK